MGFTATQKIAVERNNFQDNVIDDVEDEEKAFLHQEPEPEPEQESEAYPQKPVPSGLSRRFWFASGLNCACTASIVFVNKRIFENQNLRHAQVGFAAFHFAVTAITLYAISRPRLNVFQAKHVPILSILPLALAMICNVVLLNLSLAYSSIQFYQIVRVLVTPCVAGLNYVITKATIPVRAALTLIPVCAGVAVVSYFDTAGKKGSDRGTSLLGVVFGFAALFASAIYTVWIDKYHKKLECTSMQLLLNQAPVSVLVMLYIIPLSDDVTAWATIDGPMWLLVIFSGILACLINLSQFLIIKEAGPVSSTVVGHFKTCSIIIIGWIYSHKPLKDASLLGILLAVGGIVSYSVVMQRESARK